MALTDINSEDRLVQQTFATHLEKVLGWESVYAYNLETFGLTGTLGRPSERGVVLVRELKIQGVRVPHYNRRTDLVCFVNGLPLVFSVPLNNHRWNREPPSRFSAKPAMTIFP